MLTKSLRRLGFQQSKTDNCIFFRPLSNSQPPIYVAVYLDDILVAYANNDQLSHLVNGLRTEYTVKDEGALRWYLNMRILRDSKTGAITLDQSRYVAETLREANLAHCKPVSTPLNDKVTLTASMSPTTEKGKQAMVNKPYRSLVGRVNYLACEIGRAHV